MLDYKNVSSTFCPYRKNSDTYIIMYVLLYQFYFKIIVHPLGKNDMIYYSK